MNSISYLDSVLSRSFASDKNLAPPKRSRSYSAIPGSRRPSTSSGSTPSKASSFRRSGDARSRGSDTDTRSRSSSAYPYSSKLRRTGSTPAGAGRLLLDDESSSDDEDGLAGPDDAEHPPRARWSALWGLTGWIDDAINPTGTPSRSRKVSLNQASAGSSKLQNTEQRRSRRVPSLDSLLMASSAPVRHPTRRTASSGQASPGLRPDDETNGHGVLGSASDRGRRDNLKKGKFGHAASLTMTGTAQPSFSSGSNDLRLDDTTLIAKNMLNAVGLSGLDLDTEDADAAGLTHDRPFDSGTQHGRTDSADSQSDGSTPSSVEAALARTDQLLDFAEAKRFPTVGSECTELTEAKEGTLIDANEQSSMHLSASGAVEEVPTPSISRRASRRSSASTSRPSVDESPDSASASLASSTAGSTSDSLQKIKTFPTAEDSLRKRSRGERRDAGTSVGHSDAGSTSSSTPNGWLAARPPPYSAVHPASSSPGGLPRRRRRFSPSRAFKRALIALRDVLLAILTSPLRGAQLLTGSRRQRAVKKEVGSHDGRDIPVLIKEKADDEVSIASSDLSEADKLTAKGRPRSSSSLRFAPEDTALKRPRSDSGRPRTPRPEHAPTEAFPPHDAASAGISNTAHDGAGSQLTDSDEEGEAVTEEQAEARAEKRRLARLAAGVKDGSQAPQRPPLVATRSRLLPNPHPIDPMLAHDRKAQPVDEAMAREEARLQAEREAKVEERRAARRAAKLDPAASEKAAMQVSAVGSAGTLAAAKVPRGPSSSVIHHTPKILVLDLDETLIHSTSRSPTYLNGAGRRVSAGGGILGLESLGAVLGLRANENPGRIRPHMVEVVLDGRSVIYHVYKRPWVDYFLRKVASWYHVVIFTASVQEYADPVIDWLDQGRGLIGGRLFREACTYRNGSYVKNLQVVDPDLSTVCLVDNSPASYAHNQANGIPIEGWTHDPNDEALLDLLPVLDSLRFATDVRHILGIRGFSA